MAVQQVPTGAFLPVSIIGTATGSPTLVLGAADELVKAQPRPQTHGPQHRGVFCPSGNTAPSSVFSGFIFSFPLAFVGAAGSRAAPQRPPGHCLPF